MTLIKEKGKLNRSGIAVITVIVTCTVLSMIIIATDHHYHRRCERALFCVEVFLCTRHKILFTRSSTG